MQARGVIQSPVLVGRDAFLTLIERRLADAAAGSGRLLFVAGEAGIGKTRLLGVIARQAQASGFAVACIRGCPCASCGSAPSQRDLPVIVPVSGPGGPAGLGGEAALRR